jgi:hypothetical protein
MADETLLVAMLAGLHLLGLGFTALLLLPCLRDESVRQEARGGDDEDSGGGGNDRRSVGRPAPPRGPRGGGLPLPLPDAAPARVRLRDGRRLADELPGTVRRPAHEPVSPRHLPARRDRARGTY